MSKVIAVVYGGMDSTVLLHHLVAEGHEVDALSIDYGQRHRRELECASAQAALLGVRHDVADLSTLRPLLGGSALTDTSVEVPEGHYAEDNMKATVVPNRNMILLAVAGGVAVARKADLLAYGAHAGDHTIYPDCRPEFALAFASTLALADWHPVALARPFVEKTKADIVALGHSLGVDFSQTWTCYKGGEIHCGECGTCVERREAFLVADVPDPTVYACTEEETLLHLARGAIRHQRLSG